MHGKHVGVLQELEVTRHDGQIDVAAGGDVVDALGLGATGEAHQDVQSGRVAQGPKQPVVEPLGKPRATPWCQPLNLFFTFAYLRHHASIGMIGHRPCQADEDPVGLTVGWVRAWRQDRDIAAFDERCGTGVSPVVPPPRRRCHTDSSDVGHGLFGIGNFEAFEEPNMKLNIVEEQGVRDAVRDGYARIATADGADGRQAGGCCGGPAIAVQIGYSSEELAAIPDGAAMGLSCGHPTALASLRVGETVLDLGSGGGVDCFIAGSRVGMSGRAIGVDMTPEMVARARFGLPGFHKQTGLDNVEFRLGEIEHLPVADASVDVVISNCVLNLSPRKEQVWREIARVLRPGGRVAVSDLALLRPLPEAIREKVEALVGCIAGAVSVQQTHDYMQSARLSEIQLVPRPEYVKALGEAQDPLYHEIFKHLPAGASAADYITSLDISARKPKASR